MGSAGWKIAAGLATAAVASAVLAPMSYADATADLRSALAAKRGGCSALQHDSVLDSIAQRANIETWENVVFTSRFQPFEDPMPLLRQLGHPAGKAKLLSGFAPQPSAAILGAALQGWQAIPDCTYTRYGADVLLADDSHTFSSVVLAGD